MNPLYLIDDVGDDVDLSKLKTSAKKQVQKLLEAGITFEQISSIRLATELGSDPRAVPVISLPMEAMPHDAMFAPKLLAQYRYLIENYSPPGPGDFWAKQDESWVQLLKSLQDMETRLLAPFAKHGEKLSNGRAKGAVSDTTGYIQTLVSANPLVSAKDLHRIALSEADTVNSPFGKEGDDLWILGKNKVMPFKTFENQVSKAKNPGKR
jgi:hypothetical protein